MSLFGLFDSNSSSSSSSSTTQNTTDARVAGDNGAISISGQGATVNNQFTDNVLSAFKDLTVLAGGSLELVDNALTANAKNAVDSLNAVTAAPNQVGAENSTFQKSLPYVVLVAGLAAVAFIFKKGK